MKASVLVCGVSLALAAASAHAGNAKQQDIGVVSGVVVGALAGGPVGMVLGGALGALIGDKVGDGQKLPTVVEERDVAVEELDEARYQLVSARSTLARTESRVRDLEESLAERNAELAVLSDARALELGKGLAIDVLFRTGTSTLPPDVEQRLGELAAVLATSTQLRIQLDGHADPRGGDDFNLGLSDARVQAVKKALVAGGVDASRIIATAHGEQGSQARDGDVDAYAMERLVRIRLGIDQVAGETTTTTVADSK